MAVDQARHLNFFTDINLNTNINNNTNNNSSLQIGNNSHLYNSTNIPAAVTTSFNDSLVFPALYNLSDVFLHQLTGSRKISPAVKDDSGVTFNYSSVPPPSRKRQREQISGVAPSLLTVNPTTFNSISAAFKEKDSRSFSFLGEDLSLQIMQQQLELDRLISQHMEKVKMEVEQRKKQQVRRIMAAIEEAMGSRLRDKEEEIEKIEKMNWALEERVKSLCIENQIWRDLAQSNEATANALRTNLHQVLQQQVKENVDRELTDDAVSCCGSSGYDDRIFDEQQQWRKKRMFSDDDGNNTKEKEDGKKGWIYRGKSNGNIGSGRICRECGEGESSVLLLPCRHLCLCTSCGPTVNACPICDSVKNASVHVNLS